MMPFGEESLGMKISPMTVLGFWDIHTPNGSIPWWYLHAEEITL
jgi:hypothetical protein